MDKKKIEKEAKKRLSSYAKHSLIYAVTMEILANSEFLNLDGKKFHKDKVKMMAMAIIKRRTGKEEKILNASENMMESIEIIGKMVENISKDFRYLTKILNVSYEGNNIFGIHKGVKYFKINIPPFNLENKNIIRRINCYDQNNEKFTNFLEDKIFEKEMKLNYDYNIIDAILSRFIWENYKLTREYKLKTMYK